MFVFTVCLVLSVFSVEGSVVFGVPTLYNNYQGEYAASYDNYVPRPYAFEYGVSDPHTGDHKTQWETKDPAGVVRGSYSLLEPDGTTRIVDYIADDHGFRAIVKKIGIHGQSVESHGGAVEGAGLVQPIVVPDIEPLPVHLEQPVQVAQQIHVQQPVQVAQQIHVEPPAVQHIEQAPIFQSYDGGAEHYQNLVQPQQSYALPIPRAEGIYLEAPREEYGGYIQQKNNVYLQEPQAAPLPIGPSAGLYYTQNTEVGNPQGKSEIVFHQPQQQVVVPQEHIAPVQQEVVSHQNLQQYQISPQNYQLEQNYPIGNQILVQNQAQVPFVPQQRVLHPYGESSQSYQGTTGNLQDDSEYTNYAQGGNEQIVLNQDELWPAAEKYGSPLPLNVISGQSGWQK